MPQRNNYCSFVSIETIQYLFPQEIGTMMPAIKNKIETCSLNRIITLKLDHWAYYISFGKPNIIVKIIHDFFSILVGDLKLNIS